MILFVTMLLISPLAAAGGEQKFVVDDPAGRNSVTFKSEAPLEDIVGTSNQITGHIIFNPENPGEKGSAEFTVPISSLNTGIPLRDEHMRSEDWLDAGSYPDIKLNLDRVLEAKLVRETASGKTFEARVAGEIDLHGVTRPVEVESRLSYLPESEKTKTRLAGNLLAVRAEFEVRLADHGITGPQGMEIIGAKVGEVITIEVSLVAGTVDSN